MPADLRQIFPRYDELNLIEKFFLRTCCIIPPKPPAGAAALRPNEISVSFLKKSLGAGFEQWILGKSVLDVGCGRGEYAVAIATMGATHVYGIDLLPVCADITSLAETKGVAASVSLETIDIRSLPANAYDTVFSHDSFEHFDNPADMLAEMIRVCRPQGRIYIKFGPIWKSPYGRHMNGTFRRDRPYVHLLFPERTIMRARSVHLKHPQMTERFSDKEGGLNQMTLRKFEHLLAARAREVECIEYRLTPIRPSVGQLARLPVLREYLNGSVMTALVKR